LAVVGLLDKSVCVAVAFAGGFGGCKVHYMLTEMTL